MNSKFVMLGQCRMAIELHGRVITLSSIGSPHLRIPNTDLFVIDSVSFGDLIASSGIKVFDYALPQSWVEENYWRHGKPTPRGVWSYDRNGAMGEFVALSDMLRIVGESLSQLGITAIYAYA